MVGRPRASSRVQVISVSVSDDHPNERIIGVLENGQRIEDLYRLGEIIYDRGVQSTLHKAIDRKTGKPVVVKRQLKKRLRSANQAAFRTVTNRMLNMDHENVISIIDCYEDEEYFYTVLEPCRGGDLSDFAESLDAIGAPPQELESIVRAVMYEVLQSLKGLHARGLVHRDVKLENVMLKEAASLRSPKNGQRLERRDSGEPAQLKLVDFDFTDDLSPKTTRVVGTDGYIAPEVFLGHKEPKSDVFSAGVMMYTLMTNCFPYSIKLFDDKPGQNYIGSPKMKEIYDKMASYPVKWQAPVWESLPEAKAFCAHLLEFDVQKRYDAETALEDSWFEDFTEYKRPEATDDPVSLST
jgi:serine/threonine protein kinase